MKCSFIGHRDTEGIENKIYECINQLIKNGISEFYSGGMGNFDKMCEKAVKKLGGKIIFVPYNVSQIKIQNEIWYDEIICPFGTKKYSKFDIPNRNKWLVDTCDIFLCHVCRDGGAMHTMKYAEKKKKRILYL